MTYSRRSFFLLVEGPGEVRFWLPVDLTILPACEAAAQGPVQIDASGARVDLLVRNNSAAPLKRHGLARRRAQQLPGCARRAAAQRADRLRDYPGEPRGPASRPATTAPS